MGVEVGKGVTVVWSLLGKCVMVIEWTSWDWNPPMELGGRSQVKEEITDFSISVPRVKTFNYYVFCAPHGL